MIAIRAAAVLILVYFLWSGIRVIQIMRDPAWHSKSVAGSTGSMEVLMTKIKSYEAWNTFLADRSKGWITMELYSRLFPDIRAIMVQDTAYTVRPDAMRDKATVSFVKEWAINGFANDDARARLTEINSREGIKKVFRNVMDITGDESMNPDLPTRNLSVNLLVSENKKFDIKKGTTPESRFPVVFRLTISQRIAAEDPLAFPTAAAP